jgi:cytoskeletal protein CcmA (bactofilin family)
MAFFKKNRVQQDIDSFKTMQEGLGRASRKGQPNQQEAPTNSSAANQHLQGMGESTGEPTVSELTSSASDHQHSIVSSEATWEGKLRTEASARIEGTISGEIEAGDTVFIAKSAHVQANVNARRVVVAGELEGQITCREQLVVEQTGRLKGKVSTKTIVIEEGAVVQSQIHMLRDKESMPASSKEPILAGDRVSSSMVKASNGQPKSGQTGPSATKPVEL